MRTCNKRRRVTRGEKRRKGAGDCVKKKLSREAAIQKLYELALGRANDAIELVYRQELSEEDVRGLNLVTVAEFRRSNLGSVEIKFIDRVKALEALIDLLDSENDGTEELLRQMLCGGEDAAQ